MTAGLRGRWEAAKTEVPKSELQGADCERATHVITAMTVGAFAFYAGAASEDSSGANVAGVGAGGKASRSHEELSQAGDPSRCEAAADQDKEPARNCSAVIRVEVTELGEARTVCPEGTEQRGAQCVRKEVVTEVECPAGSKREGETCVASMDTACAAGMHFATGRGCVADSSPPPSAMIRIPAGRFNMGTKDAQWQNPVRAVQVASFEVDATEVTVDAYKACVSAGRCSKPGTGGYCNWSKPARGNHPINCVDQNQAKTYCEYVGKRLPSEAEWEYAARGPDGRAFPWGNAAPSSQLCWRRLGSRQGTCAVGTHPAGNSPFGVQDMAGNVGEWTSAFARGGGWKSDVPDLVHPASRWFMVLPTRGNEIVGIRCAR